MATYHQIQQQHMYAYFTTAAKYHQLKQLYLGSGMLQIPLENKPYENISVTIPCMHVCSIIEKYVQIQYVT